MSDNHIGGPKETDESGVLYDPKNLQAYISYIISKLGLDEVSNLLENPDLASQTTQLPQKDELRAPVAPDTDPYRYVTLDEDKLIRLKSRIDYERQKNEES